MMARYWSAASIAPRIRVSASSSWLRAASSRTSACAALGCTLPTVVRCSRARDSSSRSRTPRIPSDAASACWIDAATCSFTSSTLGMALLSQEGADGDPAAQQHHRRRAHRGTEDGRSVHLAVEQADAQPGHAVPERGKGGAADQGTDRRGGAGGDEEEDQLGDEDDERTGAVHHQVA